MEVLEHIHITCRTLLLSLVNRLDLVTCKHSCLLIVIAYVKFHL